MNEAVDLVVIGAGVAGLTAAATAAEWGLETVIIEHLAAGGQIATVDRIMNAPGFPDGVAGYELGPALQFQAENAGASFLVDTVEAVSPMDGQFSIRCAETALRSKTVILATGSHRKALGVPGEATFLGRGVSHCASCDGPFFRGKDMVIVGGGDSAFDEAALLAEHAATLTIIHQGPRPTARSPQVRRVEALPNISILAGRRVEAIEGDTELASVMLDDGVSIPAAAVFPYIGQTPNTDFVQALLRLDSDRRVVTGSDMQASVPGCFAAGDVRSGFPGLISNALGDGAQAAQSAWRLIKTQSAVGTA
ncbi:MAG: NAD(P)/FAD-dependent oxidoreductase [Alphaproteobacteria bacterium]|nr:NAD(P)/FAD-dependent oxidoreductase [Alphaproteobacteria bacterium]MBU0832094.1 NAD(P)/FAD-dependent oxidoreductase [Alphaproteobacteria bacterium]MBU1769910.1 NAD(P)/FAD-dependent oxidoreductase [Alphaproteobacteria bacterium]